MKGDIHPHKSAKDKAYIGTSCPYMPYPYIPSDKLRNNTVHQDSTFRLNALRNLMISDFAPILLLWVSM